MATYGFMGNGGKRQPEVDMCDNNDVADNGDDKHNDTPSPKLGSCVMKDR